MKDKKDIINRNKLMALNSLVVFISTILNIILGMEEVKLVLGKYGTEINGLMQTGKQILGYLSLIEAGLCAAYMYKLYGAVAQNDNDRISSLYMGFKKSMTAVVRKMLVAALCICIIYPLFVLNKGLDYLFMVSVLILLSLNSILPYRLTIVPKYMIILKEQRYKAELIAALTKSVTFLVEIFILVLFSWPVQILLLACTLLSVMSGLIFRKVMFSLYEDELSEASQADESPRGYSGDLVVHNISNLVFNSTDNVVLSVMGSFNDVTIYSSYNMIVGQVIDLSQKIADGATATLGIKIAAKEDNAYSIFREIFAGSMFAAGVITAVFLTMINQFIGEIWIGEQYCLDSVCVLLFAIILYCGIILPSIQEVRSVSGLFKESKRFILAQAIVNLVITVVLVPFYGVKGALLGTAISRFFITVPFSYFLIYRKVFDSHPNRYYEIIIGLALAFCIWKINSATLTLFHHLFSFSQLGSFILQTIISTLIAVVIIGLFYSLTNRYFRSLCNRLLGMILRKKMS